MTPITLTAREITRIADAFTWAADRGTRVRVAVDGGFKFDIGDGAGWTEPLGTLPQLVLDQPTSYEAGCRCVNCTAAVIDSVPGIGVGDGLPGI